MAAAMKVRHAGQVSRANALELEKAALQDRVQQLEVSAPIGLHCRHRPGRQQEGCTGPG